MKLNSRTIIFILLGLLAFYFVFNMSTFKSTFGFGANIAVVVPEGVTTLALPTVKNFDGQTLPTINLIIPSTAAGVAQTVTITGLSYTAAAGTVLSYTDSTGVAKTHTINATPLTGITVTGSGVTTCLATSDVASKGFTSATAYANAACVNGGFKSYTTGTRTACGSGATAGFTYQCDFNVFTVSVINPYTYGTNPVTYTTYNSSGTAIGGIKTLSFTSGSASITDFIKDGYIALTVTPAGGTAKIYYYSDGYVGTGNNTTRWTAHTTGALSAAGAGMSTLAANDINGTAGGTGTTITLPSATVTVTIASGVTNVSLP